MSESSSSLRRNSIEAATDVDSLVVRVSDNASAISVQDIQSADGHTNGTGDAESRENGHSEGPSRAKTLVRRLSNRAKHQFCPFWANRITVGLSPIAVLLFMIAVCIRFVLLCCCAD